MSIISRWYSDRGFGFVKIDEQEAFLHISSIKTNYSYLPRGIDLTNREVEVQGTIEDDKGRQKVTIAQLLPTEEERATSLKFETEKEARLAREKEEAEQIQMEEERLRRELGQPTIIIPHRIAGCYRWDILIDEKVIGDGLVVTTGDYVKFDLPSCGRSSKFAKGVFKLTPGGVYVLMHESYNAQWGVYVSSSLGLEKIFEYGDGHGKRWGALYRVTGESWRLDYSIPTTHGHGKKYHRFVGDKVSCENRDIELELEQAKRV